MSYWNAFMPRIVSVSEGSSARKASCSNCGIEKGLCEKSIFLSSSFHSYIGKSTIQQSSNVPDVVTPSSVPMRRRAAPASFAAFSGMSQAKNTASPAFSPDAATIAACAAGGRNLAIGPLPTSMSPSASKIT